MKKEILVPMVLELDGNGNKTLWFNNLPLWQHDYMGGYGEGAGLHHIDELFRFIYKKQAEDDK